MKDTGNRDGRKMTSKDPKVQKRANLEHMEKVKGLSIHITIGERAHLKHVEKLERLHFEPKRAVNEQEDQVCVLGSIDHCIQVLHMHIL